MWGLMSNRPIFGIRCYLECVLIFWLISCDVLTSILLNKLDRIASSYPLVTIIPVLHDIPHRNLDIIASVMASYQYCSVSLRTPTSLESFSYLRQKLDNLGSSCVVGVSTVVSKTQIDYVKSLDVGFISTTYLSPTLVAHAHKYNISVLCGVSSASEAAEAIQNNVQALKFYPSNKISPMELKSILRSLHESRMLKPTVPITVAGGVLSQSIESYTLAGAQGFAIGISCHNIDTSAQLRMKLEPYLSNEVKVS